MPTELASSTLAMLRGEQSSTAYFHTLLFTIDDNLHKRLNHIPVYWKLNVIWFCFNWFHFFFMFVINITSKNTYLIL